MNYSDNPNIQTDETLHRLTNAMFDQSFPVNPIPFAQGLADFIRDNGSDSITSTNARRILWVLLAQSYGQLATINLNTEWTDLYPGNPCKE